MKKIQIAVFAIVLLSGANLAFGSQRSSFLCKGQAKWRGLDAEVELYFTDFGLPVADIVVFHGTEVVWSVRSMASLVNGHYDLPYDVSFKLDSDRELVEMNRLYIKNSGGGYPDPRIDPYQRFKECRRR